MGLLKHEFPVTDCYTIESAHTRVMSHANSIVAIQLANKHCLLNQVCAGHRPARAWFLKIDSVLIVGMHACVCVRARGY